MEGVTKKATISIKACHNIPQEQVLNVVLCEIHGTRDVHGESLLEMTVKNISVEAWYY